MDLPLPVGPVRRNRPFGRLSRLGVAPGSSSTASGGIVSATNRMAMPGAPRSKNRLSRNRPNGSSVRPRSRSWRSCRNASHSSPRSCECSSPRMRSCVSAPLRVGVSGIGARTPPTRRRGADPGTMCRSLAPSARPRANHARMSSARLRAVAGGLWVAVASMRVILGRSMRPRRVLRERAGRCTIGGGVRWRAATEVDGRGVVGPGRRVLRFARVPPVV